MLVIPRVGWGGGWREEKYFYFAVLFSFMRIKSLKDAWLAYRVLTKVTLSQFGFFPFTSFPAQTLVTVSMVEMRKKEEEIFMSSCLKAHTNTVCVCLCVFVRQRHGTFNKKLIKYVVNISM